MAMHIGKISAELPTMQSGSRSQDTQNERQEKELAKNVPTTDENLLNKNSVKEITTQLNEFLEPVKTNLKFEYHEDLNDYYVTIVNSSTKEVIKESENVEVMKIETENERMKIRMSKTKNTQIITDV